MFNHVGMRPPEHLQSSEESERHPSGGAGLSRLLSSMGVKQVTFLKNKGSLKKTKVPASPREEQWAGEVKAVGLLVRRDPDARLLFLWDESGAAAPPTSQPAPLRPRVASSPCYKTTRFCIWEEAPEPPCVGSAPLRLWESARSEVGSGAWRRLNLLNNN